MTESAQPPTGRPRRRREATPVRRAARRPPSKPDLDGRGLSHPARYSDNLLDVFRRHLVAYRHVLDPFAGTGRIHELGPAWDTVGVEIEPEWAHLHPRTIVGNALALQFEDGSFDAICTSPTYGNRFADHHEARDGSVRRTYRHDLGRALHPDNSGQLQWGEKYREFHAHAWAEALRVLRDGGRFVLNVKNHVRNKQVVDVTCFHLDHLESLGLSLVARAEVSARSLRVGANGAARVSHESVLVFDLCE